MGDYIIAVILGSITLSAWVAIVREEYHAWQKRRQSAAIVERVLEGDKLGA
jgi:hypothetical protein